MKPSDRLLALRYAKALFAAAEKAGRTDKVRQDLASAVRGLRDRMRALQHPLVPVESKKKAVRQALPSLDPVAAGFLDLLVEKKRGGLLAVVAAAFEKVLDQQRGTVRAQVRSALPLADPEKERLSRVLERFSGKKVQLEVRQDPGLIGGVVVRLGDWVLDASLAGRLGRLRENLGASEAR